MTSNSVTTVTRSRDAATTSRIMSAVRSKNTRPELLLRRAVHAQGGRFRIHAKDVTGCPDLVVRTRKVAVFVDGDLWHGNPAEWQRRGRDSLADLFPNRTEWWVQKIEKNVRRDREVDRELSADGWRVIRLWASDVVADPDGAARVVLRALRDARRRSRTKQLASI
ncbi:very short patch repair endonuclease [Segeticoccus rhizosphaerae]|uniref:very short patch repair endonuclease n=1 Tax=Segeticoccus rhizosphaerae TaxID=1104777 RepID=UPI0010C0301D|nr:very short patch repair endonuclease [Ornithinicoccus soli]